MTVIVVHTEALVQVMVKVVILIIVLLLVPVLVEEGVLRHRRLRPLLHLVFAQAGRTEYAEVEDALKVSVAKLETADQPVAAVVLKHPAVLIKLPVVIVQIGRMVSVAEGLVFQVE